MADILRIDGLEDARRAIEALTMDMRRKVVRQALRDAAKPIVQQARSNAPVLTGLVKKRLAVAASRLYRGQRGQVGVYIRPRATALARRNKIRALDPYYYKFQEAGYHATGRAKRKNVPNARFIPGKAFMGRAFESCRAQALEVFQQAIAKRIEAANRRK